jgi:hypothetical protein
MRDVSPPVSSVEPGISNGEVANDEVANGEVELLLLQLRQAHRLLDRAVASGDRVAIAHGVQKATDSYGSVKDVLPKLGLGPSQIASVREQLGLLHARLLFPSQATERSAPAGGSLADRSVARESPAGTSIAQS